MMDAVIEPIELGFRAVFFDMDGTLVRMPLSEAEVFLGAFKRFGLHFSFDQISNACKEVNEAWEDLFSDYTRRTREAFIAYNHSLLESLGVKNNLENLSEATQDYWENMPNERIFPEVEDVLKALQAKGIILGVLSNRPYEFSVKSLQKYAIKGYFRCIVSPDIAMAPKGKLGPEMWKFATSKVDARVDEAMHIDDDYETGVIGARKAGLQGVLIKRTPLHSIDLDCPVISNLTGILKLL